MCVCVCVCERERERERKSERERERKKERKREEKGRNTIILPLRPGNQRLPHHARLFLRPSRCLWVKSCAAKLKRRRKRPNLIRPAEARVETLAYPSQSQSCFRSAISEREEGNDPLQVSKLGRGRERDSKLFSLQSYYGGGRRKNTS